MKVTVNALDRFLNKEMLIVLKNGTQLRGKLTYSKEYCSPYYRRKGYYVNNIGFKKEQVKAIGMITKEV